MRVFGASETSSKGWGSAELGGAFAQALASAVCWVTGKGATDNPDEAAGELEGGLGLLESPLQWPQVSLASEGDLVPAANRGVAGMLTTAAGTCTLDA